eukprot:scaffold1954_cov268-Pinguiococcus_pyrenoidosus.AAC.56
MIVSCFVALDFPRCASTPFHLYVYDQPRNGGLAKERSRRTNSQRSHRSEGAFWGEGDFNIPARDASLRWALLHRDLLQQHIVIFLLNPSDIPRSSGRRRCA